MGNTTERVELLWPALDASRKLTSGGRQTHRHTWSWPCWPIAQHPLLPHFFSVSSTPLLFMSIDRWRQSSDRGKTGHLLCQIGLPFHSIQNPCRNRVQKTSQGKVVEGKIKKSTSFLIFPPVKIKTVEAEAEMKEKRHSFSGAAQVKTIFKDQGKGGGCWKFNKKSRKEFFFFLKTGEERRREMLIIYMLE